MLKDIGMAVPKQRNKDCILLLKGVLTVLWLFKLQLEILHCQPLNALFSNEYKLEL